MNAPERVLIAIDGSDRAAVAIELAASVRWPDRTTLDVVEVMEPVFAGIEVPGPTFTELERRERAHIEIDLARAGARLAGPGPDVRTTTLHGRPATEILAEAERRAADLVIVGSRGRGPLATMLLGSVAAEIVDNASCPVLVARRPSLQRIVVTDDGSAAAARAVKLACLWPLFKGLPARAISVAPADAITGPGPIGHEPADQLYAEAIDALRSAHDDIARDCSKELTIAGVPAEPDRRFGDPAQEIITGALEHDADLIVIGTRGQSGLERLLLGSVARKILTHAPMSVLIVPAQRRPRHDLAG